MTRHGSAVGLDVGSAVGPDPWVEDVVVRSMRPRRDVDDDPATVETSSAVVDSTVVTGTTVATTGVVITMVHDDVVEIVADVDPAWSGDGVGGGVGVGGGGVGAALHRDDKQQVPKCPRASMD